VVTLAAHELARLALSAVVQAGEALDCGDVLEGRELVAAAEEDLAVCVRLLDAGREAG